MIWAEERGGGVVAEARMQTAWLLAVQAAAESGSSTVGCATWLGSIGEATCAQAEEGVSAKAARGQVWVRGWGQQQLGMG